MKTYRRKPGNVTVLAILVAIVFLAMSGTASAAFLYWATTPVQTGCLETAHAVMVRANFQNIRRSPNEVAGSSGGAYAAVTCVGSTAVIMVAGDNGGETARVRDMLRNGIRSMRRID